MANDFQGIRLEFEKVRRKLHNGEKITAAEFDNVKRHAEVNPCVDSLSLYAIAKKNVEEENTDEE